MTKSLKTGKRILSKLVVLLLIVPTSLFAKEQCKQWDDWERYASRFIQDDGRVVEYSASSRTTSEGQAYALFFALVANDKQRFEAVLNWSNRNLADGRLGEQLPSWLWGNASENDWRVLDSNSASDADLWFAYTLLEAGRLWNNVDYKGMGDALLKQIKEHEIAVVEDKRSLLLPGAEGFQLEEQVWRLNPSYTPPFILQYLSNYDPTGPWRSVYDSFLELLSATTPHGLVADWVTYKNGLGFGGDFVKGTTGSFDAIRVYLWLGLTSSKDRNIERMVSYVDGMHKLVTETWIPPMFVDVLSGANYGAGTTGFYAALIPYMSLMEDSEMQKMFAERVQYNIQDNAITDPPKYYAFNLSLFGLGFYSKHYEFDEPGKLCTNWNSQCKIAINCQ